MPKMTGGEATVQALLAQGVDTLFVLPGVQNDALFNALYEAAERLRVIVTRHEQAAGYMAYGYAAASGRPGVYCVVPGPGFLNTTAALATAYACNALVVCLSGQVPLRRIGRGFGLLHELPDQLGIMQRLTKWAARIEAPHDAAPDRRGVRADVDRPAAPGRARDPDGRARGGSVARRRDAAQPRDRQPRARSRGARAGRRPAGTARRGR